MSNVNTEKVSPITATIEAKEGENFAKNGDCIGTYGRRCLVFMPQGCQPGREYRVLLEDTGRKDKNELPLYRGRPAPREKSERWVENPDRTISRQEVSTFWDMAETVQVVETRAKITKDGDPGDETTAEIVWGTSFSDARMVVIVTTHTPIIEETVRDGKVSFEEVSRRSVVAPQIEEPLTKVRIERSNRWLSTCLKVDWEPEVQVVVSATTAKGSEKAIFLLLKEVVAIPWLADHFSAPFPVCECGRERIDTTEGHTACAQCRKEQEKVTAMSLALSPAKRQEQARIAAMCSAAVETGGAIEGEAGSELVRAFTPEGCLPDWSGYLWYYFTPEGFFASRFPPIAMGILSMLDSAKGNGLVMLAAWLPSLGYHKAGYCEGDFYARTQERGEEAEARTPSSDCCVAVKLRGNEAERQAAVEAKIEAERLGLSSYEAGGCLRTGDYVGATRLFLKVIEEGRRRNAEEEAERKSLGCLADGLEMGLEEARAIRDFAKAASDIIGVDAAISLFHKILWTSYGRTRRQEDLKLGIPGIEDSPEGARILGMGRRQDVDRWLSRAAEWLVGQSPLVATRSSKLFVQTPSHIFTPKGERHFECGECGRVVKMEQEEWNRWRNTDKGHIRCACGEQGDVVRSQEQTTISAKATTEAKNSSPPVMVGGLKLDRLFGGAAVVIKKK